jgi:hypothetical protein
MISIFIILLFLLLSYCFIFWIVWNFVFRVAIIFPWIQMMILFRDRIVKREIIQCQLVNSLRRVLTNTNLILLIVSNEQSILTNIRNIRSNIHEEISSNLIEDDMKNYCCRFIWLFQWSNTHVITHRQRGSVMRQIPMNLCRTNENWHVNSAIYFIEVIKIKS